MDRLEINDVLSLLDAKSLKVDVEGVIYDSDDNNFEVDEVEEAIAEMESDLTKLKAVLVWAKSAPLRGDN